MKRRKNLHSDKTIRNVSKNCEPVEEIPLVHVTSVGLARDILKSGKLEPAHCKVFNRNLVYLFVARPDFKMRGSEDKTEHLSYFPVSLVFKPSAASRPFHVYPFDTGGAANGAFDELADEYVFLEDYELEANLEGARRHIAWAFGSTRAYYEGEVDSSLIDTLPEFAASSRSFIRIAGMSSSKSNRPDRISGRRLNVFFIDGILFGSIN